MPVKKAAAPKTAAKKETTPTATKAAAKPASKKSSEAPRLEDFINEVKAHAFDLYLRRAEKGIGGDEIGDWTQAEKEIKAKYGIK